MKPRSWYRARRATGAILPISQRIGLLDRKLRIVDEHTENDLMVEVDIAGIPKRIRLRIPGDSLLITRANLLLTFVDHYNNSAPTGQEASQADCRYDSTGTLSGWMELNRTYDFIKHPEQRSIQHTHDI